MVDLALVTLPAVLVAALACSAPVVTVATPSRVRLASPMVVPSPLSALAVAASSAASQSVAPEVSL